MPGTHLNIVEISDAGDPRLGPYCGMRDAELRHRERGADPGGCFMAEGELVVRRLIASPYRAESVLLTRTRLETLSDALADLPEGAPIYLVDQRLMNSIAGFNIHRGVLACARRGPAREPRSLLASAKVLVVLENLTNHDNVGGILRSAAGLAGPGAAVLLSPGCCDPLYRKSIRVSMGHALHVPFAAAGAWPEGLALAREAGWTIVALTPGPGATSVEHVQLPPSARVAILLGAEGPGLTPGALESAHLRVRIPISTGVDSLNVGVAAAIALHRLCHPEAIGGVPGPVAGGTLGRAGASYTG